MPYSYSDSVPPIIMMLKHNALMTTDLIFTYSVACVATEKLSHQFNFINSEVKAVVLEVLTVHTGIVVQARASKA